MVEQVIDKEKFKETELGWIPKSWKIGTLGEVSTFINDGTHHTPRYVDQGVPFYSVENVTSNDFTNTKKISLEEHNKLVRRCKPEQGDVLLTRIGTLGKTKLIDWDVNASIYVSLALIKLQKGINSEYVYNYTKSNLFVSEIIKRALTNAVPQKINMNEINAVKIILPDDEKEQQAIASVLTDMDELIKSLEKIIDKKQKIKQGTMQQLLTGKKRLPGFTSKWKNSKVKDISKITTGNKDTQDKIENGLYPFYVRSSTVERIDTYSFDGEAVLTAGDGVGTGKIFHYVNEKFSFHQRVYKISQFSKEVDGYYFYIYFSNNFLERIESMTAKSSVDSVRMEMIANMEIVLPSYKEQKIIASILSDMDDEIEILEEKLEKYEKVKEAMMQQLLAGRIRLI